VSSPNQRRLNGLVPESQPESGQPGPGEPNPPKSAINFSQGDKPLALAMGSLTACVNRREFLGAAAGMMLDGSTQTTYSAQNPNSLTTIWSSAQELAEKLQSSSENSDLTLFALVRKVRRCSLSVLLFEDSGAKAGCIPFSRS